jgi:putative DNA primase/helicase
MTDLNNAARGRWPDILASLGGLSAPQLTDKHQPCPLCGGEDRYRFDDLDGSGSWFCNQCGGKHQAGGAGSGMDLLMRLKGWEFKEAAQRVEQFLGLPSRTPSSARSQTSDVRRVEQPPSSEPPTQGAEAVYRYSSTFIVCRFPGKKIRPLSWIGGKWEWKAPKTIRPLLFLEQLQERHDAPVLIVEGEKTAIAAQQLFPAAVVTTWSGGCKALSKTDWAPLAGRKTILWPDADAVGQQAMLELAQMLHRVGAAQVRMVAPPQGVPEGWDLADATWSPAEANTFVRANIADVERSPDPEPEPLLQELEQEEPEPDPVKPAKGGHFTCLGFDGEAYYYQPRSTGQVVRLSRSAHTSTNLVAIAPLTYWESLYPGKKEGVNWTWAAASLFEQQAAAGVYSPERVRGRGAWWDAGRAVLHLGDRLIADGQSQPVTRAFESAYLYQRLSRLHGPGDAIPLTDAESMVIWELADRFHWEVPASGILLAGWVTLAPICGALPWRPHAWLTAAAGSGKSAILDRYVGPLLGDMGLHVQGNTSEAGLRQTLRADALPVVFDEAESNEKSDQVRMQSILALARAASSESHAQMLKGTPGGDVNRYSVRSMFLMSSIATALKQGADRSRFAQLTLRNPTEIPKPERTAHWAALDRDLDAHINDEVALRLIARTVSLIPVIRQSVRIFSRAAADRFDSQRLGDQYGTLLAGAWSLMSSTVPTEAEALGLIDQNDWEPYSQTTEVPDERRCIETILQSQVRVEADRATLTRSLGELVELSANREHCFEIGASLAEATLNRYGIRVDGDALLVSNTARAIAQILRDTPWGHSWGTLLSRLPGAEKAGVVRFKGAGATSRAVRVPFSSL